MSVGREESTKHLKDVGLKKGRQKTINEVNSKKKKNKTLLLCWQSIRKDKEQSNGTIRRRFTLDWKASLKRELNLKLKGLERITHLKNGLCQARRQE